MVSSILDNSESSLIKREMETSVTKRMLALPSPNKRAAWKSIVDNVVKSVSNEELKSSLMRIGQAEKIPIKWNRLNQPKFSTFLNSIIGYQVNPIIDEKSWELISKALEEQCKNRDKNDISKSDATKNALVTVENIKKRKSGVNSTNEESGNKKTKKMIETNESIENEEVKRLKKKEKKKLDRKQKKERMKQRRSMECAQWQEMILGMIPEAGNNQVLIRELRIVSNSSNLPHKKKWSKFNSQSFMMFLSNMPAYSINQTTEELWNLVSKALKKYKERPKIATQVESAKVPKINIRKNTWIALWENVIVENTESELTSLLEKISQFDKFPKYLNKVNREIFMRFLKNVDGCPSNPTIDEKVWNLFSNALEERKKNITVNATATNEEERQSQVNETSNQADDTLKQAVKAKWCTIGKQILRAQDNNELCLENFQKLIVDEYLKQTVGSNDCESVEALWSKCYKKLSKNKKFRIHKEKIKLVS